MSSNPRVLMTFGADSLAPNGNPYTRLLVESLQPYANVRLFSWREALFGDYDILHVHWPDHLVRTSPWGGRISAGLIRALLLRLRVRHVPIVRTLHNLAPHAPIPSASRRALMSLDAATDLWIAMSEYSRALTPSHAALVIPHGHYREAGRIYPTRRAREGAFLFFGTIHHYKGLGDLVRAANASGPPITLNILGDLREDGLSPSELAMVHDCTRMAAAFGVADEDRLIEEISLAQCVVLPYRELLNSGAALLALSLYCPVLLPRSESSLELQEEFGAKYVKLYDPPLTPSTLTRTAAEIAGEEPLEPPDLSRRDWALVSELTVAAYLNLLERRETTDA